MATAALSTKELGSIVKIKENGVTQDFYVAQHGYPTVGNGRTLLVRRHIYDMRQWHTSDLNAYAASTIDTWLNSTYFNLLPSDIRAQIAEVDVPYTPGNKDTSKGSLSRKVFLLSMTELHKRYAYCYTEGSKLSIADMLDIATDSTGTKQVQWTRSPDMYDTVGVFIVNTYGTPSVSYCSRSQGVRPVFTVPSTFSVEDDGSVSVNTPPTINYSGSKTLETQNEGFAVSYDVFDINSDIVTVTEKIDGVTQRTHKPALEETQQFQAVLPQNFQTILNGNHTMTIEATDGKDAGTPVTITFTKAIYSCSITLAAPVLAMDMPTVMRLSISGSIPQDATWSAEVCNNGYDASPAWEDIKPSMQNGFNYVFINKTKTAENWGINIRINVGRGPSNTGGYINSLVGAYE